MNCQLVWFGLVLSLCSLDIVLSDILCKDSTIDSVTYADDQKMFFFTSGGYYWYIKAGTFPPKDSEAKRLPDPFKIGQAAVYVDSDNGCASSRTEGVKSKEKQVWISESIGGVNKLIAYDVKTGTWGQPLNYNKDHCISRAKIDWSNGKPLDAMFARNYLEIFFIQGDTYAMVDCKFVCSQPDGWGDGKDNYKTSDLNTIEPINAMLLKQNKELFMFHQKVFYILTLESVDGNGRIKSTKSAHEKDIIKEFLEIKEPGECGRPDGDDTPVVTGGGDGGGGGEGTVAEGEHTSHNPPLNPEGGAGSESSAAKEEGSGGSVGLIIGVIIVVVIIISVAILVFFMMRKKSDSDSEANKGGEAAGAVAQSPKSSVAPTPGSKVGSKMDGKPQSKVSSSLSIRSKLGEKADKKPTTGKSTAKPVSAVKSSVPKK